MGFLSQIKADAQKAYEDYYNALRAQDKGFDWGAALLTGALTFAGLPWLASAVGAIPVVGGALSTALTAGTSPLNNLILSIAAGKEAGETGKIGDALLESALTAVKSGATNLAAVELETKLGETFPDLFAKKAEAERKIKDLIEKDYPQRVQKALEEQGLANDFSVLSIPKPEGGYEARLVSNLELKNQLTQLRLKNLELSYQNKLTDLMRKLQQQEDEKQKAIEKFNQLKSKAEDIAMKEVKKKAQELKLSPLEQRDLYLTTVRWNIDRMLGKHVSNIQENCSGGILGLGWHRTWTYDEKVPDNIVLVFDGTKLAYVYRDQYEKNKDKLRLIY